MKKFTEVKLVNFAFQLLQTNFGTDVLIPSFLRCLEPSHIIRIKLGALETLNILFHESTRYCTSESNVRYCVQCVTSVLCENSKNKNIVVQSLEVLSSIREKAPDITIEALCSIPEAKFTLIKTLAETHSPELDSNIIKYFSRQCDGSKKENSPEPIKSALAKQLSSDEPSTPSQIKDTLHLIQEEFKDSKLFIPLLPKSLKFIFNCALNGSEESHQIEGLYLLQNLFKHYSTQLELYLLESLDQLIKGYAYPRKLWKHLDDFLMVLVERYSAQKIITLLLKLISPSIMLSKLYRAITLLLKNFPDTVKPLLPVLKPHLLSDINHSDTEVRKSVVFCLVEVSFVLESDFEFAFSDLSVSQKKLVSIYMQKRTDSVV